MPDPETTPAAPAASPLDSLNDLFGLFQSRLGSEPHVRALLGILEPVLRSPDLAALVRGTAQNEIREVQLMFDSVAKMNPIGRAAVLRRLTPEARAELAVRDHQILEQVNIDQAALEANARNVGVTFIHALIALAGIL